MQQPNLLEDRSGLYHHAAKSGLVFGLFWIIKYLCVFGIFRMPLFMGLIYMGLTIYVPFMAYSLTKKYRDSLSSERFSFSHGWLFGILLYFFASILVTIPHFIFYSYILPSNLPQILDQMRSVGFDKTLLRAIETSMNEISPIKRALGDISNNTIWGIVFSLPVAILLKRNAPISNNTNQQ